MKISDIHYPPIFMDEIKEKTDFLARYLQLPAEFGKAKEGKKLFDEFHKEIDQKLSEFQSLVLSADDPDEPNSLEEIKRNYINVGH